MEDSGCKGQGVGGDRGGRQRQGQRCGCWGWIFATMRWQRWGGNGGGGGNDAIASDGNDNDAVEVDDYDAINIRDDRAAAAAKVVETAPVEAMGAAPDAKGGGWETIGVDGKDENSGTDAWGGEPWLCCLCFEEYF